MNVELRRNPVWPGTLRVIHVLLGLSLTTLLVSGALLGWQGLDAGGRADLLRQLHLPAGYVLAITLAVRLLLLIFADGVAGWRALLPVKQGEARRLLEMLRFYLSWRRNRLPPFFAQDPLWAPLHLLLFLLLALQTLIGLALEFPALTDWLPLDYLTLKNIHNTLFNLLLIWVILHIVSVILRELRGRGNETSSMIHGEKLFVIDRSALGQRGTLGGVHVEFPPKAKNDEGQQ
ncbi:MAG: cytochrome b/b6 domain-containing protein [Pseudomonadota bacterium]